MSKLKSDIKKFLNLRNALIGVILLIASLIWSKYLVGVLLIAAFAPITFLTVRYSKMIPHVSAESNTAMSCLMGYVFGPAIGFGYGVVVGGISYLMNSFVSLTYMTTIFFAGLTAAITGLLHNMDLGFSTAFTIAILIRTVLAWITFGFLGIDPIERFTHQASQLLTNLIFYLPLMSLVYDLVSKFI